MFHTVVHQGFQRGGEKYYIYFVDNSLPFPTVKQFSESTNSWWS